MIHNLRTAFPQIQLVISTHSPQVVSAARPEWLRVLHPDGTWAKVDYSHGRDSNSLLRDVFGVSDRPEGIVAAIREIEGSLAAGRLDDARAALKVEHFVPRSADRSQIFEWMNLLGACSGKYVDNRTRRTVEHCDGHRTEYSPGPPPRGLLNIHPAQTAPTRHFRVNVTAKRDGLGDLETLTDGAGQDLAELNLNASRLVADRAGVVRELRIRLRGKSEPELRRFLRRRHRTATTPGPDGLPPYAHVEAEYLLGKLRQRGLTP